MRKGVSGAGWNMIGCMNYAKNVQDWENILRMNKCGKWCLNGLFYDINIIVYTSYFI